MIGWLRGRIVHREPTRLVVDVQGIGYVLHVPLGIVSRVHVDETHTFFVHTHVTDGKLSLYGFDSPLEQETFENLIKIHGIGPRLALSILSHLQPDDLARVVIRKDGKRLSSIPGIGPKTAERVILELAAWGEKHNITEPHGTQEGRLSVPSPPSTGILVEEALQALEVLGYKRREVEALVRRIAESQPDLMVETLVHRVLRERGSAF